MCIIRSITVSIFNRLTDENKKLIQLVTTLDRQVNNFEDKFIKENENITQRIKEQGSNNSDITKDHVIKIVKENLEETKQDNVERSMYPVHIQQIFQLLYENFFRCPSSVTGDRGSKHHWSGSRNESTNQGTFRKGIYIYELE